MTQPLISILLPHLREPENDRALQIAVDTLIAHTDLNYELMIESVAERRDIYPVINQMAARAAGDWIVFWNSDVFASPNWIQPLYDARHENAIVSPTMVECGAIGVSERNLYHDFGMTPDTYRRAEFEQWVRDGAEWSVNWIEGQRAWYFPSLLSRARFLALGGFDAAFGHFPTDPVDIHFWDGWEAQGGEFIRARAWVYHLQHWSSEEEQEKVVRRGE